MENGRLGEERVGARTTTLRQRADSTLMFANNMIIISCKNEISTDSPF